MNEFESKKTKLDIKTPKTFFNYIGYVFTNIKFPHCLAFVTDLSPIKTDPLS